MMSVQRTENDRIRLARAFVEKTGENIFLTGKAGTGKTTFLRTLQEKCSKRLVVVAPTGVAAVNAHGVTIHSFFQLPFGIQLFGPDGRRSILADGNVHRFRKEKISILRSLDLLVIDEISMVRADVLDAIDYMLRRYKDRRRPFGGVQLLMIGDLRQLAPVVKPEERKILKTVYETPYFFSSRALQETGFIGIELTEVFRQKDESFLRILNDIRENRLTEADRKILNSRYDRSFSPDKYENYIVLTTHNRIAESINRRQLNVLVGKAWMYEAEIDGNFPEYSYPTEMSLQLKVGARVMFVKNDTRKRFYNGKTGTVTALSGEGVMVHCDGEDEPVEVGAEEWNNYMYSLDEKNDEIVAKSVGRFFQVPLKPAWAVTIHKSQGLTFDHAVIDAKDAFAYGQVYVALSRCRTLEGMVLSSPIVPGALFTDKDIAGFTHRMEETVPDRQRLLFCENKYAFSLVEDLNDFSTMDNRIKAIVRILEGNVNSVPSKVQDLYRASVRDFGEKVLQVSGAFGKQLKQLLLEQPDVQENKQLNERIEKASVYYLEQLDIVECFMVSLVFDTDNTAFRKSLSEALKKLAFEYQVKKACLKSVSGGFDIEKYQCARAVASLDKNMKIPKPEKKGESASAGKLKNPELYGLLRSWRDKTAKEKGVIPYQVIQVKSMQEIATLLPRTEADLKQIGGIGKKKLETYGREILDMVADFIEAYGIGFDIKKKI